MLTGLSPDIGMLPIAEMLPQTLLGSISELPLSDDAAIRWPMRGVSWTPRPCRGGYTAGIDGCTPSNINTSDRPSCEEAVEQAAFSLHDVLLLSTLNAIDIDITALMGERFDGFKSHLFAEELLSGGGSGGMSLAGSATEPDGIAFGDPATPIWNALTVLEAELSQRLLGRTGLIHIAPGLLAQAVTSYGLHLEGGVWRTPLGNRLVTDSGYTAPVAPDGETASAAGEDWVYASGPVFYRSTASRALGTPDTGGRHLLQNKVTQWVSGSGLLVFDPCPVTAVLASYALEG